jgi:hypothetical protein
LDPIQITGMSSSFRHITITHPRPFSWLDCPT